MRALLPDLHLIVAGEPREAWDQCQQLLDEFHCRDRVHLVGALRHDQVLDLMSRANGLIFPSRSEGMALVLLEAGAHKLPVVCSRIGPFMEVASDGESALMVTPEDADDLAEGVLRVVQDPMLADRLGQALHARVQRQFSAQHMVSEYLQIYRQLVAIP